ncbi:hypothetical protein Btru_056223 [Bulinus truncatus]|nr:hypothetical protein Btru_056223 [Bulinus truncatus]
MVSNKVEQWSIITYNNVCRKVAADRLTMSYFPAAELRTKSSYVTPFDPFPPYLTSIPSKPIIYHQGEPSPIDHFITPTGQMYRDAGRYMINSPQEYRTDLIVHNRSGAFRPPYSPLNSNNHATVATYNPADAKPLTVRIPQGPKSCPPCSPVTRIVHSASADGASSPGTKTVTFEVPTHVPDDNINLEVQAVIEKLGQRSKLCEEIPVLQLKEPPKGKKKRPLSSDSDSFSSDLHSSSASLNSSTTSESFQKLHKSPGLITTSCALSAIKSPKKLKPDGECISPFPRVSSFNNSSLEDGTRMFPTNDANCNYLKLPICRYPQTPIKNDSAFCSTPLEFSGSKQSRTDPKNNKLGFYLDTDSKLSSLSNVSRPEIWQRTSSSSILHLATNEFRGVTKTSSLPKLDFHNSRTAAPACNIEDRINNVSSLDSQKVQNSKSDCRSTVKKVEEPLLAYRRRKDEPSVFIFPETGKKKNEDEVDGFGNEQPMDMEVDSFDDQRSHHLMQHNSFQFPSTGSFQNHFPGKYSQDYGAYSSGQRQSQGQSFHFSNNPNYETPNFNAARFSSSNTLYHKEYSYTVQPNGSHGLISGDDLDSLGTSQTRARKKDSEVLRTPKDNRTKMTSSSFEDILDVGEHCDDVQQVLNKFSDQEINQSNNASSKQDVNNNSGHFFADHRRQPNVVSTRADMNVHFVSVDELPDSDMSCDDMDDFDDDRGWDETDGPRHKQVKKKSARKAGKSGLNKMSGKQQGRGLPHRNDRGQLELTAAGETDISVSNPQRPLVYGYSDVVESQRRRSLPSIPKHPNTFHHISKAHNSVTNLKTSRQTVYLPSSSIKSKSLVIPGKLFPDKINSKNVSDDRAEARASNQDTELSKNVGMSVSSKQCGSRHSCGYAPQLEPQQHQHSVRKEAGSTNPSMKFNNPLTSQPELRTPVVNSSLHTGSYNYYNDGDSDDGGDEVDGLGDDNEHGKKKIEDRSSLSHAPPQKPAGEKHDDDIVHCFGASEDEVDEVDDDRGHQSDRSGSPTSRPKTHLSLLSANKPIEISREFMADNQKTVDGPVTTIMSAAGNFAVPEKIKESTPSFNRQNEIRTSPAGAVMAFSQPHSAVSSCSPVTPRATRHQAQIKDDMAICCFQSPDLRKHMSRRSSDTISQVSPDLVIPRSSSSPSKLENSTSGEKLTKCQQTFHRPWISPDNKKAPNSSNCETRISGPVITLSTPESRETTRPSWFKANSSAAGVKSHDGNSRLTQGLKSHDADTRSSAPGVRSQAGDTSSVTPDTVNVFKYSSTSDPNRYSDVLKTQSIEPGDQRTAGHQPNRSRRSVGKPAKRNRVDRRLNFESQTMDNNNKQQGGVSQNPVIGNPRAENSENPESPWASKAEAVGNVQCASDSQLEGATSAASVGQTSIGSEAGAQLRRVCDLVSSRGESESTRQDNEIDVRIEVTDSLRLSERLEQIYQANDRSCECARIEQEILSKAIELFKELCDPSKRYDNWKIALRDTNNVIRDSLEVADAIRQVCCHGRTVTDVLHGSVILRLKCRTLMSVVDLCHKHSSGDLHRLLCTILCTHVHLKGLALKVSIDPLNVQRCISFLSRAIEDTKRFTRIPQTKVCSDRRRAQEMKNDVRSSPSTPTIRVSTQTRCSSSPALHTYSPLYTPTSVTEKRDRTFSFGETRMALQELNLSDRDSPTSPFGSSSRWNYSPSIVSSPLTPLRQVTSPHLRTSPLTSPLTSPRKPKRHDVIQEQENMGDASIHL